MFGIVDGDDVVAVDGIPYGRFEETDRRWSIRSVELLPPVQPGNFYAAGLNYRGHIRWMNDYYGCRFEVPVDLHVGYRSPSALIGSGADVVLPANCSGTVEYEGELVAIIGTKVNGVSESEALNCVAGYTLGNDVTERTWQLGDRTLWRAKNSDTFKPMGPIVVSGIDPMDQEIEVRVNGRTSSRYNTGAMIFSVAEHISRISTNITLYPGDVIWFGCEGPTLPSLVNGDTVEVVIPVSEH